MNNICDKREVYNVRSKKTNSFKNECVRKTAKDVESILFAMQNLLLAHNVTIMHTEQRDGAGSCKNLH